MLCMVCLSAYTWTDRGHEQEMTMPLVLSASDLAVWLDIKIRVEDIHVFPGRCSKYTYLPFLLLVILSNKTDISKSPTPFDGF